MSIIRSRVLVPVTRRQDADRLVPRIQEVVDRGDVAHLTLVRVAPLARAAVGDYPLEYEHVAAADAANRDEAAGFLRDLAARVDWKDVRHDLVALQGLETSTLAEFAASGAFDAVLVVPKRRAWYRRLFSVNRAYRLLDAARLPIVVMPGPELVPHASH